MDAATTRYFESVYEILKDVEKTQLKAILKASEIISESIAKGGVLRLFGTGHSHMVAEEPVFRAGGLAAASDIYDCDLAGNLGMLKSMDLERLPGFGKIVLDRSRLSENDVLIVVSVSGRNAVPVDVAMEARKRGFPVIAITSMDYSKKIPSRHPSGKHLCDVADVVIDNRVPVGDAVLEIKGSPQKVAATSTVVGAAIMNAIVAQVTENLSLKGIEPPVFLSGNIDGADEYNKKLIEKYKNKIIL